MPEIWIGGSDLVKQGTFSWINGDAWNYTNWAYPEQPNHKEKQDCIQMREDGFWDDVICSKVLRFICQQSRTVGAYSK